MNKESTYHFFIKQGTKEYWGKRPLNVFQNENNYVLQYMRDVDFTIFGKENEKIEIGIFSIRKEGGVQKMKEMIQKSKVSDVQWIFRDEFIIHFENMRKVFDMKRGEMNVGKGNYEIRMTCFERENKEYIITTPVVTINM